jgi:ketosteroid isomerase-like protein
MKKLEHQLITDFLQAMIDRDSAGLRKVSTEDIVWNVPPSSFPAFRGPHVGIAATLSLVVEAGATMFVNGTQSLRILHIIVEGDHGAAQFRISGKTTQGELDYDNLYAFFFRFSSGHIAEIWEHVDTGYLYGLLEIDPVWVRPAAHALVYRKSDK